MGGLFVAIFAFLAAIFAVVLAATAVDEARSSGGSGSSGAMLGGTSTVSLSEFAVNPGNASVPAGSSIEVRNDGAMIHNLSVDGVASSMLEGGESEELDLSSLEPGVYTMKCDVPGHADAGMKGSLTIE